MKSGMKSLPYAFLVPVALFLAVAPIVPEPHLVEKLRMLASGTLRRPLDIFDLFWHAGPLGLLLFRLGTDGAERLRRER